MRIHERRQVGILANVLSSNYDDAVYLVESGRLQMPQPSIALAKQVISQTSPSHAIIRQDIDNAAIILAPNYKNKESHFEEIVDIFKNVLIMKSPEKQKA